MPRDLRSLPFTHAHNSPQLTLAFEEYIPVHLRHIQEKELEGATCSDFSNVSPLPGAGRCVSRRIGSEACEASAVGAG